ncbi:MAG: hypothetical protein H6Q66_1653 [Firmicutes bacterium]|nr:hypothetical protein [Bacillota bacterium]
MREKIIASSHYIILLIALIFITGCSSQRQMDAGLMPVPTGTADNWRTERISSTGTGNSYQVVTGKWLAAGTALQLSAGGEGRMEYFDEIRAGREQMLKFRLQFLSTQGTGRLKINALDEHRNVLGSIGWVYSGRIPVNASREVWIDARYGNNYSGNWLEGIYHIEAIFHKFLPDGEWKAAHTYQCSIEVGEGQHVLITGLTGVADWSKAVGITAYPVAQPVLVGDIVTFAAAVQNETNRPLPAVAVSLLEPYGYGLIVIGPVQQMVENLKPGEIRQLSWRVKAQRPDAVNLGRPWEIQFAVDDKISPSMVSVPVKDPRPGRICYVMTEDLEPIDSAGYNAKWGNANGWLEPQEIQVQMINKAEKLNEVAERHGAKWTHYIAWPAVKAAEWAALQPGGKDWQKTVEAVQRSVTEQAARGHEYALHLHMDYDPILPGNILSYNAAVNGIWANHLRHGWAHSIGEEGYFNNYASRIGTLYAYQKILDALTADSEQGQILTARAGSFDFGNGDQSEKMSISAYKKIGLWGTSDADGNEGKVTAAPFGQEIYFTGKDDINRPAKDLRSAGLVEFRPTPKQYLSFDNQTAATMNTIVDQGVTAYMEDGSIKPGIHAIVGFTHAMFIMGNGDWKSVEGGQFEHIGQHLAYVRKTYADRKIVQFATASELVKTYLAYYSPEPVVVYGPRKNHGLFFSEYGISVLGDDIPIDQTHSHTVKLTYPLYLRDSAYHIKILKNGETIYATWGLPTVDNSINFVINDRQAKYTLRVYENRFIYKMVNIYKSLKSALFKNKE